MSNRSRIRTGALFALLLCLSLASQAQAAQVTGIADENLDEWSPAAWAAFDATGVKQVRHTVAWNVADGNHQGELNEAASWISQAEAHGLSVLISFRVNWGENVPPPTSVNYRGAVYKFRQNFPQITQYTAWNEPNHKYSFVPNANTNGNPTLAAQYWVALNAICHSGSFSTNCTVIGGDFLEPKLEDASNFVAYVNNYKAWIAEAGSARPSAWAIHPYTAAETGNWQVFNAYFKPLTENKSVWFTEVGGMVCKNGTGYTGDGTKSGALAFADGAAANLVNHSDGTVARTYYYSLGSANDGEASCPGFDSTLLGAGGVPRPAYKTVFPGAPKPTVQTTEASGAHGTQATLNGTVDPRGLRTSYRFEYGTTAGYGSSTGWSDAGYAPGAVGKSATVNGLQPGTTYHYRIVASNVMGTEYGGDVAFTLRDVASDVNGDGKSDLVECDNSQYLAATSNGSALNAPTSWSTWGCGPLARLGDFNGDGKDDLLVPAGGTSWAVGDSRGNEFGGSIWSTSITNSPTWMGVGDFNGDGKDDFATCLNNEYKVNLGGNSSFQTGTTVWSTWGCGPLARVGDFNGDGKDDLAVPGANNSWAVALSSGTGFNGAGTQTWLWGFTNQPAWVG
jgi:FG-GAP-like repeat/FG-GAP repeat